ncbi:MAG: hypothetical protein AB7F22_30215 [Reyranella sp.]|uniref:hypothetical protein n=1 Tax=Reyranella sp. TaxID=1929291 RepID=UPI003D0FFF56
MSKSRIYIVRGDQSQDTVPRLVRAANKSAALRFAARTSMTVGLASQDDIIYALDRRVAIEDATEVEDQE